MSDPILVIWRQLDGFWRWRYRDPGDGTDLLSNEGYPDRDAAAMAARTAYPGVWELKFERGRPRLGRWFRRLALIGLILWLPRRLLSLFKGTLKVRKAARILRPRR